MRAVSVRPLIRLLGASVAAMTAILPPVGYALIGYVKEAKGLSFKAELSAERAAQYIYSSNTLWQYQTLRLDTAIALPGEGWDRVVQRIYDANGKLVLTRGEPLALPISRSRPIVVGDAVVGRVEVDESLQSLVAETGLVALVSMTLGLMAYFAFAVALKVLNRTLGELETANFRLDTALENMAHGLSMYNGEQRLVVANVRYAEMYGLSSDQVKPGTTFRQVLEQRVAAGNYVGSSPEAYIDECLASAREQEASSTIAMLVDGRAFAVARQPMAGGGWVSIHQDITRQRSSEAKIAHMALHDALTGLPNRLLLNERLQQALTRVARGEVVAVHFLDLDHFKNVNDTLGHPTGDKLLKLVTDRLHVFTRDTDTIARMGGDEFAILQVAISQPADATMLAQRIIEAVNEPYEIDRHQVVIGTSVGIAMAPMDGDSPDQLMRNADLALYRAKSDGRGSYCFFEPGMDAQMQARRAMECDLRQALVAGQFELYYQPIVSLVGNEITGVEALIRWHHPEQGTLEPGKFIPLAEEIGFIVPLGEWVLKTACATAVQWPSDVRLTVNLSPVQFRSPGLVRTVANALATSGLPAARLELEITEAMLMEDTETTLATLFRLRSLGVTIAMDDFGTGYSSLSYLQSFPFDRIKIDRSFIKDIGEHAGSLNIVRAVAAMAAGLGMVTTASGVETQQQRDTVASEGCTEMQGFLFSAAVPAPEITLLFQSGGKGCKHKNAATAA
jgi:diguanylate cyclase (GGDEF)-like protein